MVLVVENNGTPPPFPPFEESQATEICGECGRQSLTDVTVCKGTGNPANKGRWYQKVRLSGCGPKKPFISLSSVYSITTIHRVLFLLQSLMPPDPKERILPTDHVQVFVGEMTMKECRTPGLAIPKTGSHGQTSLNQELTFVMENCANPVPDGILGTSCVPTEGFAKCAV